MHARACARAPTHALAHSRARARLHARLHTRQLARPHVRPPTFCAAPAERRWLLVINNEGDRQIFTVSRRCNRHSIGNSRRPRRCEALDPERDWAAVPALVLVPHLLQSAILHGRPSEHMRARVFTRTSVSQIESVCHDPTVATWHCSWHTLWQAL